VIGTTLTKRLKASQEALSINLEITDWFLMLETSMEKPLP
jgi:predicted oxidoreductase|tara:strand:- start:242 stop:361 length:120 start_codon:yes stop_codon:yes gene_type:complete